MAPCALISIGSEAFRQKMQNIQRKYTPTVFHRPLQIIALSQQVFKLPIIRPIDIHAILLIIAVEEIDHETHCDLAQPEVLWREQ